MAKTLILTVVSAAALLGGCGALDREVAKLTGYARSCVDGVEYLQFASGVTVAYTPDGKVKTCPVEPACREC